jgi:phosphohistidine swiveling domain-containing protein
MNEAQRRLQDAYDAYGRHFGSGYRRGVRRAPLSGIGVGEGTVTGRAVVAVSPLDALDRIGPDTILVVSATAPAYDAVLPLAVGVVVETGGLLCHAALAGRELGIPVVVGVIGATAMITDGEVITVDAAAGRVSRASSSPRP